MDRSRRQTAKIDYSRLDNEGLTSGIPLRDELQAAMAAGSDTTLLQPLNDDDSVFRSENSEFSENLTAEQENRLLNEETDEPPPPPPVIEPETDVRECDPDKDLGRDEVWAQQQQVIEANRQKRERARRRLEREMQIAEEKLREEQEREELRAMERQIMELNQKRSVNLKSYNSVDNMGSGKVAKPKHVSKTKSKAVNTKSANKMAASKNKMAPNKRVYPISIPLSSVPYAHNTHANNHALPKMSDLLALDDDRNKVLGQGDDYGDVETYYAVEADDDNGLPEAVRGPQKVRTWLSSTEDLLYVHETRSDPGDTPVTQERAKNIQSHSNFRQALREKEQQQKENRAETTRRAPVTTPAPVPAPDEDTSRRRRGRPRTPARGRGAENNSSDGESSGSDTSSRNHKTNKSKKIKSGFLDKPKSQVIQKLRWPHMNQNHRYVTTSLGFNELSFSQFVGGSAGQYLGRITLRNVKGD